MGSVMVAPGHLAACPALVLLPRSAISHRAVSNGLRRRCVRSRNTIIRSLRAHTLPPTSPAKVHLPQSLCSDSHGLCLPSALRCRRPHAEECRSLYQAKITERRARGPANFVALPRNLLRISGRPDPASKFPSGSAVRSGRPDPASKFPSGSAVRIYVRIPWSLCDLALILAGVGNGAVAAVALRWFAAVGQGPFSWIGWTMR